MKAAALAALLTAALGLLGCGGESPTTSAPDFVRGELTKSQWIAHADHLCSSTRKAIAPLRSKFGVAVSRGHLPLAGVTVLSIVYFLEKDGEHLRSLGVPTEESKPVHKFEERLKRKVELNIDLAEALEAGQASQAARVQFDLTQTGKVALSLAHRIGLEVCGTE